MSLKKIALIIPGGLGTGKNNIGVPVLEQVIQLMTPQFDITVFQLFQTNKDYKVKGFELLDFKSGNKLIQYLNFVISFYKANRKKKFTVIHGFWVWPCGFLAVILGKIFGIKSIVSILGGDAASIPEIRYGHLRKFFSRRIILWTLKNADEANALTHYLENNLKSVGLKRKLQIIPWGVNQVLFQFKVKPLQNPIQFLHIANFHPVKDQKTLLRTFEIIHSILPSHLTIIGEGNSKYDIKQWISQLKLEHAVTLRGQLPYNLLPSVYYESDILLHTSLAEGQSEVVTEAMSCGTLVAGTKVGLLHDLPQCCLSVPVGDYRGLALSVIAIVHDKEKMQQICYTANRWAISHSIEWTVNRITELY